MYSFLIDMEPQTFHLIQTVITCTFSTSPFSPSIIWCVHKHAYKYRVFLYMNLSIPKQSLWLNPKVPYLCMVGEPLQHLWVWWLWSNLQARGDIVLATKPIRNIEPTKKMSLESSVSGVNQLMLLHVDIYNWSKTKTTKKLREIHTQKMWPLVG